MYSNFYGGMDDNGYSSYNQSSFAYLKHINVHKRLGLAECEQLLDKDPVAEDDIEPGYLAIDNQNNILLFSKVSGRVYKRASGKFETLMTNPHGAHKGAFYYNSLFFFVASNGKVGYMRGVDSNDVNFDHGIAGSNTEHIPIYAWYTKVYIGGSSDVYVMDMDIVNSQVVPGNLTKTQLNIPFTWNVTDFRDLDADLVWGAQAEHNGAIGKYRRFADSFHQVDKVDGPVDLFFGSSNSNIVFALVGHNGDLVHYTGATAVLRQRVPECGVVTPNPYVDATVDGRGMFAINGKIWAYHQRKSGQPFALTHAYTCTGGEDAKIISIKEQGNIYGDDQLFVSWEKGDKSGLDSLNMNKKADGVIITPIAEWFQESSHDQRTAKIFVEPKGGYTAHYHSLPKGTSIDITTAVNNNVEARDYKKCGNTHDKSRMLVGTNLSDVAIANEKTRLTQGYIELKSSGNESPIIRGIELY